MAAKVNGNLNSMSDRIWKARTKRELMIEVWEALDCESVGAVELQAIEEAVRERFGDGAVESHASVARLLADEGAELRHPEVLEIDVLQRTFDEYAAFFKDIPGIATLKDAADSIRRLDKLRKTFADAENTTGLRRVRELAQKHQKHAKTMVRSNDIDKLKRTENEEIAEWFGVWLRQPEIFETWLELRRNSIEFRQLFSYLDP